MEDGYLGEKNFRLFEGPFTKIAHPIGAVCPLEKHEMQIANAYKLFQLIHSRQR